MSLDAKSDPVLSLLRSTSIYEMRDSVTVCYSASNATVNGFCLLFTSHWLLKKSRPLSSSYDFCGTEVGSKTSSEIDRPFNELQ